MTRGLVRLHTRNSTISPQNPLPLNPGVLTGEHRFTPRISKQDLFDEVCFLPCCSGINWKRSATRSEGTNLIIGFRRMIVFSRWRPLTRSTRRAGWGRGCLRLNWFECGDDARLLGLLYLSMDMSVYTIAVWRKI